MTGNDEKYIRDVCEAAEETHPTFIAVFGSPIAAMTGTDFKGELGGGNNKWSKRYKCSDGSSVFIYDLREKSFPTGGVLPATTVAEFTTFQFKYADMKNSAIQLQYNVYWVQTFKSLEEVGALLESEEITWEE